MNLQQRIEAGFERKLHKYVLTDGLHSKEEKRLKTLYSNRLQAELTIFDCHDKNKEMVLFTGNTVKWLRENNITYVLAGSAPSSLILWSLDITNIDPVSFKLNFVRAYDKEKNFLPPTFLVAKKFEKTVKVYLHANKEAFHITTPCKYCSAEGKGESYGFNIIESNNINFYLFSHMKEAQEVFDDLRKENIAPLYLENINLNRVKDADILYDGNSYGLFKAECHCIRTTMESAMEDLCLILENAAFSEFIDIIALCRPGPNENIPAYVKNRRTGRYSMPHPLLAPYLEDTHGVLIYQEQAMALAEGLADYTPHEADLLRRAMGQKITEEIKTGREKFIRGAKNKHGLGVEEATGIFEFLCKQTAYSFSRAHSVSIASACYQIQCLVKECYPD